MIAGQESSETITFVLPFTLGNHGEYSLEHPRVLPALRLVTTLRSLSLTFLHTDLAQVLIICPQRDLPATEMLIAFCIRGLPITVMAEHQLAPSLEAPLANGELNPWYVQQLVKLAAASVIRTDHYVTLDDDILCLRYFAASDLVKAGQALTNVETIQDYHNLYTSAFAKAEVRIKTLRYVRAAEFIGAPTWDRQWFYGETPVVMHTRSVLDLLEHIEYRHQSPWQAALAQRLRWTEYALYFQYLEMSSRLEHVCSLKDADTVLSLTRSIWQTADKYRKPVGWEPSCFIHSDRKCCQGGLFAAVQSWLPRSGWLPERFESITDFYYELAKLQERSHPSSADDLKASLLLWLSHFSQ